jgi:IstB-like ATP binding protein
VLSVRFIVCAWSSCRQVFFLCSACDRGQAYCGHRCREDARRRSVRDASRRFGRTRNLLYDNLKSVVLERQRQLIRYHPHLLAVAGHYHFAPQPCAPYRGNEKGKVERAIHYLRHSFFEARRFRDLGDLNAQLARWLDDIAMARRRDDRAVRDLFAQGLGKTMIAQNTAHQAVFHGHSVLFLTAAQLLLDLGAQESARGLDRRLRFYASVALLVVDEVGYLSFDPRNADLLFQVISRRYEKKSLVLTTNLVFQDWPSIFPNASCATALIDRVIHHADVLAIEGDSYRLREAEKGAGKARQSNGV